MSAFLGLLLAVTMLSSPDESFDPAVAARIAAEADDGYRPAHGNRPKEMRITSRRSDLDRDAGVIMFEDGVFVEYDRDYTLNADRLFVFRAHSNQLSRIVACGHVVITNGAKVGRCDRAVFRKRSSMIEMFGGAEGGFARMRENENEVAGARIRFWINSEELEVDRSALETKGSEGGLPL